MTSFETLPLWARILIGDKTLATAEAAAHEQQARNQPATSSPSPRETKSGETSSRGRCSGWTWKLCLPVAGS